MVYIGKVVSTTDSEGCDRIKVFIQNIDKDANVDKLPYCLPLMPKLVQVKPKIGEMVVIVPLNDEDIYNSKQRFYIGPIISQKNRMYKDLDSTSLTGFNTSKTKPLDNDEKTKRSKGCYGSDDDVCIYGRKNSDILLGDNDVMIRCGSRIVKTDGNTAPESCFNEENPSFVKLEYHEQPESVTKKLWDNNKKEWVDKDSKYNSVSTVVGDEINFISTKDYQKEVTDGKSKQITSDDMKVLIENCHPMVYGDKLVEYLSLLRDIFMAHVHNWGPSKPVLDPISHKKLMEFDFNTIISENSRVS